MFVNLSVLRKLTNINDNSSMTRVSIVAKASRRRALLRLRFSQIVTNRDGTMQRKICLKHKTHKPPIKAKIQTHGEGGLSTSRFKLTALSVAENTELGSQRMSAIL